MILTKDIAEKLDFILKEAEKTGERIVDVSPCTTWNRNDRETVGDCLEEKGLGKMLSEDCFMVFPQGLSFIHSNSFLQMYEEKVEKEKREERQDLLTQKQINAAKREPWLILWGVVTTILSLVLGCLQLIKQ